MTSQHPTTDLIIDYLHGELSPAQDADVHAHLATCPACRAEYDAEVALGEALRGAATAEALEFPSLISANVWQQVRNARPGPFASLQQVLRPAFALPLAAALVLGTFLASPTLQHAASRPSIDAAYYFEDHAAQEAGNPFGEHTAPAQSMETSSLEGDAPVAAASLADAAGLGATDAVLAAGFDGGR